MFYKNKYTTLLATVMITVQLGFLIIPTYVYAVDEVSQYYDAPSTFSAMQGNDAASAASVNSQAKTLSSAQYNGSNTSGNTSTSLNYTSAASSCLTKIAATFLSRYVAGALKSLVGDKVSSAVTGVTGDKVPVRATETETEIQTVQKKVQNADENTNKWTSVMVCIGNELIQQVTKSTVQWINNDFKNPDGTKGPSFISNPSQFFTGVADRSVGSFIQGLGPVGSLLCKPFDIKIRLALLNEYRGGSQQNSCSLTSIKNNFENFGKSTDYWGEWFQLTQQDNNNYMGSYFKASEQMKKSIQYNQNANQLEITLGRGFMDMKKCPNGASTCKDSEMIHTTPGSEVQQQLDRTLTFEGQRINVASSIDTLLSALMNNLMKRAVTSLQDQGKK